MIIGFALLLVIAFLIFMFAPIKKHKRSSTLEDGVEEWKKLRDF